MDRKRQKIITKTKYNVVTFEFHDAPTAHLTLTPLNKDKIVEHLLDITRDKEVPADDYLVQIIPRKRVKSFKLTDRNSFEQTEKPKWQKNRLTRINKRRKGGFFPHTHVIDNEYVEGVLQQLQIYKTRFIPESPNTCLY